jgi:hypothetical protein
VAPARFHRSALLMDAATIFFLSEFLTCIMYYRSELE